MKNNKIQESTKYYIFGGLSLLLGATILIISISLAFLKTGVDFLGWVGFGGIVIACPILFYSIYLLKKANFLKLNKQRKDIENEEKKM